jgi:hypothetical protein
MVEIFKNENSLESVLQILFKHGLFSEIVWKEICKELKIEEVKKKK